MKKLLIVSLLFCILFYSCGDYNPQYYKFKVKLSFSDNQHDTIVTVLSTDDTIANSNIYTRDRACSEFYERNEKEYYNFLNVNRVLTITKEKYYEKIINK